MVHVVTLCFRYLQVYYSNATTCTGASSTALVTRLTKHLQIDQQETFRREGVPVAEMYRLWTSLELHKYLVKGSYGFLAISFYVLVLAAILFARGADGFTCLPDKAAAPDKAGQGRLSCPHVLRHQSRLFAVDAMRQMSDSDRVILISD